MAAPARTITLADDQAEFVARLVESGRFESAEEVVAAGLTALAPEQERLERWLREDVAATYDELSAHPERAVPAKTVFDRIRGLHQALTEEP